MNHDIDVLSRLFRFPKYLIKEKSGSYIIIKLFDFHTAKQIDLSKRKMVFLDFDLNNFDFKLFDVDGELENF